MQRGRERKEKTKKGEYLKKTPQGNMKYYIRGGPLDETMPAGIILDRKKGYRHAFWRCRNPYGSVLVRTERK